MSRLLTLLTLLLLTAIGGAEVARAASLDSAVWTEATGPEASEEVAPHEAALPAEACAVPDAVRAETPDDRLAGRDRCVPPTLPPER